MASFNGFLGTLIKGSSTGGENKLLTGTSYVTVATNVPQKHFRHALFGVKTQGVSGAYGIRIVCAIGGATYVAAGFTGFANGSKVIGFTSTGLAVGRPVYIEFGSGQANVGFTSHVFMMGEY